MCDRDRSWQAREERQHERLAHGGFVVAARAQVQCLFDVQDDPFDAEVLAAENESVGFSVTAEDSRAVHCALYRSHSTVQHVDADPISPLPVLGDMAHLMTDGLYSSFTVAGHDWVCIIEAYGERQRVVSFDRTRSRVSGVPLPRA